MIPTMTTNPTGLGNHGPIDPEATGSLVPLPGSLGPSGTSFLLARNSASEFHPLVSKISD
jgi:hypothetical protein